MQILQQIDRDLMKMRMQQKTEAFKKKIKAKMKTRIRSEVDDLLEQDFEKVNLQMPPRIAKRHMMKNDMHTSHADSANQLIQNLFYSKSAEKAFQKQDRLPRTVCDPLELYRNNQITKEEFNLKKHRLDYFETLRHE